MASRGMQLLTSTSKNSWAARWEEYRSKANPKTKRSTSIPVSAMETQTRTEEEPIEGVETEEEAIKIDIAFEFAADSDG